MAFRPANAGVPMRITLVLSIALCSLLLSEHASGQTTSRLSVSSGGTQANGHSFTPCLSRDQRFVAFPSIASNLAPGDTNNDEDIFVRDLRSATTTLVSLDYQGLVSPGIKS